MCISQRKLFLASLTVANRCLIAYRSLSSTPKGITRHTPHNWSYEIYASFEHIIRGSIECLSIGQDQCIPFLFYAHASIVRFNQSIPTSQQPIMLPNAATKMPNTSSEAQSYPYPLANTNHSFFSSSYPRIHRSIPALESTAAHPSSLINPTPTPHTNSDTSVFSCIFPLSL